MIEGQERSPLDGGRTATIRAAGPTDVAAIAALYGSLSATSSARRFWSGDQDVGSLTRHAAMEPDRGDVSMIARLDDDPDRLVGEARFVPIEQARARAEFAIAVRDDVQGRGLGRVLLDRLFTEAALRGIEQLTAVVSTDNAPMLRLLEPACWVLTERTEGGSAVLEVALTGGMPAWPAVPGLRVLVESRDWVDSPQVARLRADGAVVRHCPGPGVRRGPCPLVSSGDCRLAAEADLIMDQLPLTDAACNAVMAHHLGRWPQRLHPPG